MNISFIFPLPSNNVVIHQFAATPTITGKITNEIVNNKLNSEKLDKLLKKYLTDREYKIMCLRYGLNGLPILPQREVAKYLGISRSYISRIEKHALEVLGNKIKKSDFL